MNYSRANIELLTLVRLEVGLNTPLKRGLWLDIECVPWVLPNYEKSCDGGKALIGFVTQTTRIRK